MKYIAVLCLFFFSYSLDSAPTSRFRSAREDFLWLPVPEAKKFLAQGPPNCYRPQFLAFSVAAGNADYPALVPLYRYYDAVKNRHYWTVHKSEGDTMTGFKYEGIVGYVGSTAVMRGMVPVYKFYDATRGRSFYSTYKGDKTAAANGYKKYKGVAFYAWKPGVAGTDILRLRCPSFEHLAWSKEDSARWKGIAGE